MTQRKDVLVQWFKLLGSMLGMVWPDDESDESLKRFYRALCLALHPDKHTAPEEAKHKARVQHFFKILSDVWDTYTKTMDDIDPPEPSIFQDDGDPPDHDSDRVPKTRACRNGRRVYLITFPFAASADRRSPAEFSRLQFAELIRKAFELTVPKLKVTYMAVFQELHGNGPTESSSTGLQPATVTGDRLAIK